MLHFDKIDISQGIDINKTSASKECDVCHYWYFLNKGFKFQPNICNGCYDVLLMSVSKVSSSNRISSMGVMMY